MHISDLILYKNNRFIAFNKPAGLSVQPDTTTDKSLLDLGEIYCKKRLFVIHRIDRPASGIVLFAKDKAVLAAMNAQFQERKVKKTYLAAVKNSIDPPEGTLIHYMQKNATINKSFAFADDRKGSKRAELRYKMCGSSTQYHFVEITLITGRHHQIRAQLAAIGNPVKGDTKYGFRRGNRDRSIHLHAWKMEFAHPVSRETVVLEAPLPDDVIWNNK